MCRLMFQRNDSLPLELQQVSSWDVPNLRCLPVVVNGELPDGERPMAGLPVFMDASHFSFQVRMLERMLEPSASLEVP